MNLIYPTLDLFLYDLRDGLGQTPDAIAANCQLFWSRLGAQYASKSVPENPEADRVELLSDRFLPLSSSFDGYYWPLQLGDSYGLQIDCTGYSPEKATPPYDPVAIEIFRELQQVVLDAAKNDRREAHGSIGQTWLAWGQLSDRSTDPEAIARACYEQLAPDPNWERDFYGTGNFLGASLFEFWRRPSRWQSPRENYHLLVCLFPRELTTQTVLDRFPQYHYSFLRLFCYRNKILWAYQQSREIKGRLREEFEAIQQAIAAVGKLSGQRPASTAELRQLQEQLTSTLNALSRYAIDLNQLGSQEQTIAVNIENYRQRLQQLEQSDRDNSLASLQQFGQFAAQKYADQVRVDRESFTPGLTLLENLIRTLDGIATIRRTERDRTLDRTVASAGIGLAVSSVTATFLVSRSQPPEAAVFFATSLLAGGIVALLAGLTLTAIIPRILRR